MEPQITVVIPTFNRLQSLKNAVKSVSEQKVPLHVHVLDNNSSDGTRNWLVEMEKKHTWFRTTMRNENIGALANFSDGIQSVQTKYFVPLADDDELLPGFLADSLMAVEKHIGVGAVITQTDIRRNGKHQFYSPPIAKPGLKSAKQHLTEWSVQGHYHSWSSILWAKCLAESTNWIKEITQFGLASDVWVQFLAFANCEVFCLDRVGSAFNLHESQASAGVSISDLELYGKMNRSMFDFLSQTEILDKIETREFMKNVTTRWSEMFFWLAAATPHSALPRLSDLTEIYIRDFSIYCGMEPFPLTPILTKLDLFKKLEARHEVSHNMLKDEIVMLKNSKSWKLTAPLRLAHSGLLNAKLFLKLSR